MLTDVGWAADGRLLSGACDLTFGGGITALMTNVTVHVDTGGSTITLVIALVGLLIGASALGWQVLSWRLSTSRVVAHT
jgi:hypothetical protein